jgi:hypothetical protein
VSHLCVASQCSDHQQDGNETDVDCGGGGACATCATGKKCLVDGDCATSACDGVSHLCVASQCSDHQKDGAETDVDCGGACPTCAAGKHCGVNGDCASNICASGTCAAMASCSDTVMDGTETDVDCGGLCGPTCKDTAPQQHCAGNADCLNHVCTGGLCQPPSCFDGVTNGTETDKDCGGSCDASGARCGSGLHCLVGNDCASRVCSGVTCQAPSCVDAVQNGNESDVDCGGTCLGCALGLRCRIGADCASGACSSGGVCVALTQGAFCSVNSNCLSGNCVGNICCNSACSGFCQACSNAQTGAPDGTCNQVKTGLPDPHGGGSCP